MKRSILWFLLTVFTLVSIVNIGYGAEKITLRFFHYLRAQEQQVMISALESFMKKYPDIEVKYEFVPESDYITKILTLLAAGEAPDVIGLKDLMIPDFALQGVLMDLDPFFKSKKGSIQPMQWISPMRKHLTYRGKIYTVPEQFSPQVLYGNKKLFRDIGIEPTSELFENLTWEGLIPLGQKLTRDINGDGKIDIFAFGGVGGRYDDRSAIIWNYGGQLMDPNFTKWTLDTPQVAKAYQVLLDMIYKYHITPTPLESAGLDLFSIEKMALVYSNRYNAPYYASFNWANDRMFIARAPKGPVNDRNRTSCRVIGVVKTTKYPDEAWKLVCYLTNEEGYQLQAKAGRTLPYRADQINKKFLESWMLPFEDADVDLNAISRWHGGVLPPNSDVCRKLTMDAWDAMILKKIGVKEGLKKLNEDLNKAIKGW